MGRLRLERPPCRALLADQSFRRRVPSVEEGSPNAAEAHFGRAGKEPADPAATSRPGLSSRMS
ncbi:MAG: hypothetical protein JRN39_03100 [Nitrososphaerota archaeon]|nr:hypothetical protein [Nitrososphaerota archaeon]MDG6939370.1 hypothetical protein [Nitrososphaerota archaeon]